MADDLNRREVMMLGAAAVAATAAQRGGHAFFTAEEFAVVDELSEVIIPADAHSPGARAARVAEYIDARLAEAWDPQARTDWRAGLKPFLQAAPDGRVAMLTRMAAHEEQPQTPEEKFFVELKARVIHAYYSSEIGIKRELEYQGNSYLTEFVGFDAT